MVKILETLAMNGANLISLGRLLSVPVIVWLIVSDRMMGAFGLFLVAGISDAVDGFLARTFKLRTALGAYLDPLADKALLIGVYATLGYKGLIPHWIVILIIFRDVLIIGGTVLLFMLRTSYSVQPLFISKLNTAAQIWVVTWVLAQQGFHFGYLGVNDFLSLFVALTTILSGGAYVIMCLRIFAQGESAA